MAPLRILVCSPSGGGKTTLCTRLYGRLRSVLPSGVVYGFLSRPLLDTRGYKVGYELFTADGRSERIASSDGGVSDVMVAKYHVYVKAIDTITLPVLAAVLSGNSPSRICVLDDIGAMTSKSNAFVTSVRQLLQSPDPDLHVLAAVGMGEGFMGECRRLPGITCVNLNADSRDSRLESLTSRCMSVMMGGDDDSDDKSNVASDDEDLTSFDPWGGDAREFGVKRGMYNPKLKPSVMHPAPSLEIWTQDGKQQQLDQGLQHPQISPIMQKLPTDLQEVVQPQSTPASQWHGADTWSRECRNGAGTATWASPTSEHVESNAGAGQATAPASNVTSGSAARHSWGDSRRPGVDIVQWLGAIDSFLPAAYGEAMRKRFYHVEEVVDAYMLEKKNQEPSISEKFFQDFAVTKLGHKRLFQKWFREKGLDLRHAGG